MKKQHHGANGPLTSSGGMPVLQKSLERMFLGWSRRYQNVSKTLRKNRTVHCFFRARESGARSSRKMKAQADTKWGHTTHLDTHKKMFRELPKSFCICFYSPFWHYAVVGSTLDRIWCSRGVQKGKVWVPILELLTFVLCETYLGFPAGSVVTIPPASSR